jgi:hypothetical protein
LVYNREYISIRFGKQQVRIGADVKNDETTFGVAGGGDSFLIATTLKANCTSTG